MGTGAACAPLFAGSSVASRAATSLSLGPVVSWSRGAISSPFGPTGSPSARDAPWRSSTAGFVVSPAFAFWRALMTLPAMNSPLFWTAEEIAPARARRAAAWVRAPRSTTCVLSLDALATAAFSFHDP